jgi:hypothetical protein
VTVEVLVMCSGCGRSQPPRARCVQCGALLPEAPVTPTRAPEPTAARGDADRVELEIGGGRRVVIGPDALELRGGAAPSRVTFASMHRVRLEERRPWVLLPAVPVLLFAAGFFTSWPARVGVLLLLGGTLWLFARQRRFVVHIERTDGAPALLDLGGGRAPLEPAGVQRVFVEIADQLKRRGVNVVR